EGAGPAADERDQVQCDLGRPSRVRPGCRLVETIRDERRHARPEIERRDGERQRSASREPADHDEKKKASGHRHRVVDSRARPSCMRGYRMATRVIIITGSMGASIWTNYAAAGAARVVVAAALESRAELTRMTAARR